MRGEEWRSRRRCVEHDSWRNDVAVRSGAGTNVPAPDHVQIGNWFRKHGVARSDNNAAYIHAIKEARTREMYVNEER